MSTYRPRKAPGRRVYHQSWRKGYLVNSKRGAALAASSGYGWIDNDFHFCRRGLKWVNAHGAPETFWLDRGDKFEFRTWQFLSKLHRKVGGYVYSLRTANQALHDNARAGIKTEFEVKDVHPYASLAHLSDGFERLRVFAESAYGPKWVDHITVKVLTNLAGGEAYALKVCTAAHAHGFHTMILARGKSRFHRFDGKRQVTWVRGSAVIR